LLSLTADIVSAHLSNNMVATGDVANLIQNVHRSLETLGKPSVAEEPKREPAVPIRSSVKNDHIVCLEDGAKLKMLKRYLRTRFDMTPDDYRAKWGLPRDYPMVAPAYAETRRGLAKSIGLGRKKVDDAVETVEADAKTATKSVSDGLASARAHLGSDQPAPARKPRAKAQKVPA
jgi:predicted transcriptional regulator